VGVADLLELCGQIGGIEESLKWFAGSGYAARDRIENNFSVNFRELRGTV
jgi:hypothetical protein